MAVNPHSEPAKMEQIITEFFAKSLHIILESRCPIVSCRNYSDEQITHSPSSSSPSMRPRDKWFNLALRDCPAALENIDFWGQNNLEPMFVDVVLVQTPPLNWDYTSRSPKVALKERYSDEFRCSASCEKIIERWIVRYESKKGCKEGSTGSKRYNSTSSHALYKKSILLLRSLYVTVRLLPAYKIFSEMNSSGRIRTFNLIHRVSSSVKPLLRRDEDEMQPFMFTPVDTSCGKLLISVLYFPSISYTTSELSTPMSPQFIPDYVGSPLADPLKRLPSVPVVQYSSSSSPFGSRHSWSYDSSRASPTSALPSPSPSPSYSDSRAFYSRFGSHRPPISSRYPLSVQVHNKDTGYDECYPSPNFSPSPSHSPPMCNQGSDMSKVLLRSDSAPVYMPTSRLGDVPISCNKSGIRPTLSLLDRRVIALSGCPNAGKLLALREEQFAKPSGVKISSSSSPHKSFSRSLSRLPFENSYDDSEFSGPFVVDDDDTVDHGSRPGSSDQSGSGTPKKSQDAAVGALIQMLKKAPPLRQDLNPSRTQKSTNQLQDPPPANMASSRASGIKTSSDAFEELKMYTDMKQLLRKQSGKF